MLNQELFDQKSLLIVDDDPDSRESILELLLVELPTLEIWMAPNGREALHVLGIQKPDIILLDWEMPEMNGIEFLAQMLQNKKWKRIPVLMYTGAMTLPENLKEAMELGAVDFLRKPANPIELITRLKSILWQKKLENERFEAETKLMTAEKAFLKKELDLIKKDLQSNLLLVAQKNQQLMDLRESCEVLANKGGNTRGFAKIIRSIDIFLEGDDYWESFIKQFDKTDIDFSLKLLEKHPDLTSKEVRACALIRLGLDNKTIAHLLNISGEGIKKKRYRIRKKLSIDRADNLDHYIFSF